MRSVERRLQAEKWDGEVHNQTGWRLEAIPGSVLIWPFWGLRNEEEIGLIELVAPKLFFRGARGRVMMRIRAFSELKKFVARWRKELVGLAVLVGLVAAVLFVLWLFGQITFVKQEVTIVKIITGLLVLVGLYWTMRRVRAAEKTVGVVEEGHITDRFTKAIAQLGDDKMAIRLGGIYALERVAKDSEKDHGPIMEVLTAYVRQNAYRPGEDSEGGREEDPEEDPEGGRENGRGLPTTDIQAILTVIGRRETTGNNRRNDPLDLTST